MPPPIAPPHGRFAYHNHQLSWTMPANGVLFFDAANGQDANRAIVDPSRPHVNIA